MTPTVTARYDQPRVEYGSLCSPRIYASVGVETIITYDQGDEQAALEALARAYAELKRQITGMATIVPGEHQED